MAPGPFPPSKPPKPFTPSPRQCPKTTPPAEIAPPLTATSHWSSLRDFAAVEVERFNTDRGPSRWTPAPIRPSQRGTRHQAGAGDEPLATSRQICRSGSPAPRPWPPAYISLHWATACPPAGRSARAFLTTRSLGTTTTRMGGLASAGRGLDHDVVLDRDVDAIGVELQGPDRARAVASKDANVAPGCSGQFPCVVQAKPNELAADSTGVLETCLQVLEAARQSRDT
jgi:hypothetical protein